MLLNDEEIQETMESPLNLLNRLKSSLDKTSRGTMVPSLPPKAEDIITDLDDRLKDSNTRLKAAGILNEAMDELRKRLPEVQKPEKLASIAELMSKVVKQQDDKNNNAIGAGSQIIVYAPRIQSIENYRVVKVNEEGS